MSIRGFLVLALLATTAACSSNSSPTTPTPSPSPATTSVSIVANSRTLTTTAFNPNPITITRGGTVTWVNDDTIAHTSTSDATGWDSGSIAAGARFSMTFQTAGTFPYHCTFHRGMVGTVTVQ